VKVYLLTIDNRRFFFYADASEAAREDEGIAEPSVPPAAGFWGRLQDRYHQFKSTWEHSDSRIAQWTRRSWVWLHSWSHPDESMLVRLRSARRIDLHHPTSHSATKVRALWVDYLNHRWWRHLLWMSLNGVIAPFTIVFAILPGPNVIGYWFAYRAIHHSLIVWGIRRVRAGRIRVDLHALAWGEAGDERGEGGEARHAALDGDAAELDEHVAWSESEPSVVIEAEDRPGAETPGNPTKAESEGL
jgi:Mitochondrial K+-H+ exchange-related